jgi:hypothetical protein
MVVIQELGPVGMWARALWGARSRPHSGRSFQSSFVLLIRSSDRPSGNEDGHPDIRGFDAA